MLELFGDVGAFDDFEDACDGGGECGEVEIRGLDGGVLLIFLELGNLLFDLGFSGLIFLEGVNAFLIGLLGAVELQAIGGVVGAGWDSTEMLNFIVSMAFFNSWTTILLILFKET